MTELLEKFFYEQLKNWDMARRNFESLAKVEHRIFDMSGLPIRVEWNPERVRSTTAKVDPKSIAKRSCFLCAENRPESQMIYRDSEDYEVLVNPYPIFPKHFTIAHRKHLHQDMLDMNVMAEFAMKYEGFVAFYNASCSGASAPDHLHFQAGNIDYLPLCEYIENHTDSCSSDSSKEPVKFVETPMHFLHYDVPVNESVAEYIDRASRYIGEFNEDLAVGKSLRNILMWKSKRGRLQIVIIPRKKHRPARFYSESDERMLVSPGAVDMAGVIILPRKEDFEKITSRDIVEIYDEVGYNSAEIIEWSEMQNK